MQKTRRTRKCCNVLMSAIGTITLLTASIFGASVPMPAPKSLNQIVTALEQTEQRKQHDLQAYSSTRRYILKNARFNQDAEMIVKMDFSEERGKHFEILSEHGAEGISRRVMRKVLDGEAETSRTQAKEFSMVTTKNYDFRLLGSEIHAGRPCYKLEIQPKMKNKYLLEGKIWVDSTDFQLVRMEGYTAASLSFWVGKPYIIFDFQKVGEYWLAARNQALTNARFLGPTELTIEVQGYELQPGHHQKLALEKLPRLQTLGIVAE